MPGLVIHKNKILFFVSFLQAAVVVYAVHFTEFPGSVPHFRSVSGGGMLLDTKPEFSVEGVYQRLDSFGAPGRAVYAFRLFTVDLLLPVSILLFLAPFAFFALGNFRGPKLRFFFLLLPWTFFLFDLAENSTLYLLLDAFPARREALAAALPFFSTLKRIGMIGSLLSSASLWVSGVRRKRAAGSQPTNRPG